MFVHDRQIISQYEPLVSLFLVEVSGGERLYVYVGRDEIVFQLYSKLKTFAECYRMTQIFVWKTAYVHQRSMSIPLIIL